MNRRRISLLILVMMVTAISVGSVMLYAQYKATIKQQSMHLAESVTSRARLIEAVARRESRQRTDSTSDATFTSILEQVRETHEAFKGIGYSGEFALAKRENEKIIFLLNHRHYDLHAPPPIPFHSELGEPMRRALQGQSGTMIGLDYRGQQVLAAYEPMLELGWGIVAKIDLDEIHILFLEDKVVIGAAILILISLGISLIYWISLPMAQSLEENENRLRGILETAADGIITITEMGAIASFNTAAERLFGYSAAEANGKPISLLLPEVKLNTELSNYVDTHSESGTLRHETIAHRKNGTTFQAEFSLGEVRLHNQRLYTGIVRDITERQSAEETLRQREEQLRLTFDNAPLGIVTVGLNFHFLSVNRAFCEMTGYSETELQRLTIADITHPADMERGMNYAYMIKNGKIPRYVLSKRYIRKDGSTIHCIIHVNSVSGANGQPQMLIGHIEDRTEQLKAKRELKENRERLAHVARISILGEMTAGIAHEINQPLTAVSTYAQACRRLLAAEHTDSDALMQILDKINNQALRAGEVIQRMRRFIKKQASTRIYLDSNTLINEVLTLAEVDLHYHHLALQLELEPDLSAVHVDPIQIQQVILNLIRNAVEAMEAAQSNDKRITIRSRHANQNWIEIAVIDQGPGLSDTAAAQLFDPFFSTKSSGMGMGLAISRSIIESHGGRLDFSRPPEGGTVFYFTLPVARKCVKQAVST